MIQRVCTFSDVLWFIFSTADLPVVYDHNNPSGDMEGVAKVIERDEYKVRKKPKGRAKFIGQSKVSSYKCLYILTVMPGWCSHYSSRESFYVECL